MAAVGLQMQMADAPILVIDDDRDIRRVVGRAVEKFGKKVMEAGDLSTARTLLDQFEFSLLFIDKCLPDGDGVEFSRELLSRNFQVPCVIITGAGNSQEAINSLENGVQGYLPKPCSLERIRDFVSRLVPSCSDDVAEGERFGVAASSKENSEQQTGTRIIGESAVMIDVSSEIHKLAKMNRIALLTGPTGVGKEVVARKIHELSDRASNKFVPVNCGAIPQELIESELFGHQRGSFTDAKKDRVGLFQEASGGTIFLDEITETSPAFQVKLLRVLQEGSIRKLGSNQEVLLDVRVIAASNRNLKDEVKAGRFREDLYFRLKGSEIFLPPLKDRREDILPLARYFAQVSAERTNRTVVFSKGVAAALQTYSWPGNVRELKTVVDHAVESCKGIILMSDLSLDLRVALGQIVRAGEKIIERVEDIIPHRVMSDRYVAQALALCGGNQAEACRRLGVDRKFFTRRRSREAAS